MLPGPPNSDFEAEDANMIPRQEILVDGNLFSPAFVRGLESARFTSNRGEEKTRHREDVGADSVEGYCGRCQPGVWLRLSDGSYWTHMTFSHGITSKRKQVLTRPQILIQDREKKPVLSGLVLQLQRPLCSWSGDTMSLTAVTIITGWFWHIMEVRVHCSLLAGNIAEYFG